MPESQASKNVHQAHVNESQAVDNAISVHKIKVLEGEIEDLKHRVEDLANERNDALKWGIIVLGGSLVSLVLWIFNYFGGHAK